MNWLLSIAKVALGVVAWNQASVPKQALTVRLSMPGWTEVAPEGQFRVWRDAAGDMVALAVPNERDELSDCRTEAEVRRSARQVAEQRGGGLIEATLHSGPPRSVVSLVYKRLLGPGYVYTGMLFMVRGTTTAVWTVVAGEHGTTGVREAIITAEMMSSGELTIESYQRAWAYDPYDPTYAGVDRSVLRFMSDDERFDARFPQHPLSKVRRVLAELPRSTTGIE